MTPSEFRDFIAKQCNFPVPVPGRLAAGENLPKSLKEWLHQPTVEIKQNDNKCPTIKPTKSNKAPSES